MAEVSAAQGRLDLPAALAGRADRGALAHAYILSAMDPEGLDAAARGVAAAMMCQGDTPPCGVCKPCRKAAKGIHPDIITVAPEEGKDLTVDQVRAMRQDVYIRPNEGKRKVYIIKNAQKMNQNAQNAFLKVLEDGPAYAAFLLLTPTPDVLLPTIRSRCETVRVDAQDGTADPELVQRGRELAELLLAGDRWELVRWCVPREKDGREETAAALGEARRALLRRREDKTTPRAVHLAQTLRALQAQLESNANVGCIWGRLWAEAEEG